MAPAIGALEQFLHDDPVKTPTLIEAALSHAQFKTIHPLPDGNSRVSRLLITLLLIAEGVLDRPLLYLSLYLKRHRSRRLGTGNERASRTRRQTAAGTRSGAGITGRQRGRIYV